MVRGVTATKPCGLSNYHNLVGTRTISGFLQREAQAYRDWIPDPGTETRILRLEWESTTRVRWQVASWVPLLLYQAYPQPTVCRLCRVIQLRWASGFELRVFVYEDPCSAGACVDCSNGAEHFRYYNESLTKHVERPSRPDPQFSLPLFRK